VVSEAETIDGKRVLENEVLTTNALNMRVQWALHTSMFREPAWKGRGWQGCSRSESTPQMQTTCRGMSCSADDLEEALVSVQ